MRWFLLILCLPLMAMTPLYTEHDSQQKTDDELRLLYQQAQPIQFQVFKATPNLADLQDGQIVRVSSGTWSNLMYRDNQEIYAIRGSCVTIRR